MAGEILSLRLLTLHNIYFYQQLMSAARDHIEGGSFSTWKAAALAGLQANREKKTAQTE
jgi:queuine tRNA-ribosyltransferase